MKPTVEDLRAKEIAAMNRLADALHRHSEALEKQLLRDELAEVLTVREAGDRLGMSADAVRALAVLAEVPLMRGAGRTPDRLTGRDFSRLVQFLRSRGSTAEGAAVAPQKPPGGMRPRRSSLGSSCQRS